MNFKINLLLLTFLLLLPTHYTFSQYDWPLSEPSCGAYDTSGPEIYMAFNNYENVDEGNYETFETLMVRARMTAVNGPIWIDDDGNPYVENLSTISTNNPNWTNYGEIYFPRNATDANINEWIESPNPCVQNRKYWWGFAGPGVTSTLTHLSDMGFALYKIAIDVYYITDENVVGVNESGIEEIGSFYIDSRALDLRSQPSPDIWIKVDFESLELRYDEEGFGYIESIQWKYSLSSSTDPNISLNNHSSSSNPFDWGDAKYSQPDRVSEFPPYLKFIKSSNFHPKLYWEHYSDYSFKIYRSSSENGTYTLIGSTGQGVFSYVDNSRTMGRGPDRLYYYVTANINGEESKKSNKRWVKENVQSSVDPIGTDDDIIKTKYSLSSAYPNPFNPITNISFSIGKPGNVTLKVYDILGNEVATLVNEHRNIGNYRTNFDGSHLSSGMYIYKLTSNDFVSVNKFILMK